MLMQKMHFHKIFSFVLVLMMIYGCQSKEVEKKNENEVTTDTVYEKFESQITQEYPNFNILDTQKGTSDNAPIQLVAIGENKDDGSSQTLFIVDDNDVIHQVTLGNERNGKYRKEDGIVLDKNVACFSLEYVNSDNSKEIHDFKLTFTKDDNQNVTYTNDETIRK